MQRRCHLLWFCADSSGGSCICSAQAPPLCGVMLCVAVVVVLLLLLCDEIELTGALEGSAIPYSSSIFTNISCKHGPPPSLCILRTDHPGVR